MMAFPKVGEIVSIKNIGGLGKITHIGKPGQAGRRPIEIILLSTEKSKLITVFNRDITLL